ncbi:MAG: hypothetical protein QM750_06955 [Rubrivivax sp.]
MRLALARTLAWTLLMAGWLQLGALGRAAWPLTAVGLLPTALWLAVIGVAQAAGRDRRLGANALRGAIVGSAALAALGLLGAAIAPRAAAAIATAVGWGLLVVAASRSVRALRRGKAALPVVPAAAGTAIAWLGLGSAMAGAVLLAAAALVLAALVPAGAVARGCRSGLFDCVLPTAAAWPAEAGARLHAAIRWTMLPMMATLAAMGEWCSGSLGLDAHAIVGLHLAAMLLPPLGLHLMGIALRSLAWPALPLAAAAILAWWRPAGLDGLAGLMAASLACALAWGLAWAAQPAHAAARRAPAAAGPSPMRALAPALATAAIGLALERFGPPALAWVLAACALAGLAGAALADPRAASRQQART